MIVEITKPLAEMTKHIQSQIDSILDQSGEVLKHKGNIKDLEKKLHIRIKDIERMELGHPRTVCTSAKCTLQVGFRNVSKTQYNSHCHSKCTLDGIATDIVDNANLKRCIAIDSETGNCKECGCLWNTHMHVTYQMKEVDREVIDKEVEDHLQTKKSMLEAKQELVKNAEKKIGEMQTNRKQYSKLVLSLDIFLRRMQLLPIMMP